jgi:hypothetical protein
MNLSLEQRLRGLFDNIHRTVSSVRHVVSITGLKLSLVNNLNVKSGTTAS